MLVLADPVIYDMDGSEVETLLKHLGRAKKALADAEVVWLEAQEFLEAASDWDKLGATLCCIK